MKGIERQIAGALRSAIDAHGPIDRKGAASAAKRVAGQLTAPTRAAALRARLPELGAIVRAYAPGQKIRAYVPERDLSGASTEALIAALSAAKRDGGLPLELQEGDRFRPGQRGTGRVVGLAWIVEVEVPEPEVLPEIHPDQQALG